MIQLGMAFGVIHHEFNHNILRVRRGIKDLTPWAKANQSFKKYMTIYVLVLII